MSDEDYEKINNSLKEIFIPQGKNCGKKIAEVLNDRGHEIVIPLYRSPVVGRLIE
jgi:hypothetical protein